MLLRNSIARVAIGFALAGAAEYPVQAQHGVPRTLRIGNESAAVVSRPAFGADVVEVVPAGTQLDVLMLDREWFWVVLAPDVYGTRRVGWLRADDVEGAREAMPMPVGKKAPKPKKQKQPDTRSLDKARQELEKARADYDQVSKPGAPDKR
jgi:hypothetical protein